MVLLVSSLSRGALFCFKETSLASSGLGLLLVLTFLGFADDSEEEGLLSSVEC